MRKEVLLCLILAFAGRSAVAQQSGPKRHVNTTLALSAPAFFAVSVADLDSSSAWYQRAFGLEVVREVESRDGKIRSLLLHADPLTVELIKHVEPVLVKDVLPPEANTLQMQGLAKAGIFVEDAKVAQQQLAQIGVAEDARLVDDPVLGYKTFFFRDLDGNRIQIFER